MRIADKWGVPVHEAIERCSPEEFVEQMALWELEPWGTHAMDAMIANQTMNVVGLMSRAKLGIADFALWIRRRARAAMSGADMMGIWKSACEVAARKFKRNG